MPNVIGREERRNVQINKVFYVDGRTVTNAIHAGRRERNILPRQFVVAIKTTLINRIEECLPFEFALIKVNCESNRTLSSQQNVMRLQT